MANSDHLRRLRESVDTWNSWRRTELVVEPDLRIADLMNAKLSKANLYGAKLIDANVSNADLISADLSRADLYGANLSNSNFNGADLIEANLFGADLSSANLNDAILSGANLRHANLRHANLSSANLNDADLREAYLFGANLHAANLSEANLSEANLTKANLTEADLSQAILVRTGLSKANLTGCFVYGLSAWDVQLEEVIQSNLVITPPDVPGITVDNLEVAQFIYLLLNNQKIRHVIDTITSKVVLILGRFTPERKVILDAIRNELRKRDYLPVLFDFEKPSSRDITETVSTLAHMARFVIADITDAKSIPQELMAIVPNLPSVPVQPLLLKSQQEYGMFEHFKRYPWALEPYLYEDQDRLLAALTEKVIGPAERLARRVAGRRMRR